MQENKKPDRPVFSDSVEQYHKRIDASNWENVYVVGDVHGCAEELTRLLSKISPSRNELVVFVGDLVRKGPESEAVVERVRRMENAVSVRGNNEQKVIDGEKSPGLSEESHEYLRSMPVVVSWGQNIVVHGGVSPTKPLEEHTKEELLEKRSVYGDGYSGILWFEKYDSDSHVFFGHTVLDAPVQAGNTIGLDTGCVYGGMLSAYDCASGSFLTVDAKETYRPRSRSNIVSTQRVR